ncbi:MAG: hypothetical protein GKR87_07765 [Kiritimatiellae bacterium]|nr:hypothetical protein [Kiritimatiellia bacterium]
MLSGYMGLNVMVNTQAANVIVGIGQNGTYERGNVPLVMGSNLITAVASDVHGNSVTQQVNVFRAAITGANMVAVSGDGQITNILQQLAEPIVVEVKKANGAPFANKLVTFDVTRSNGRLFINAVSTNAGTMSLQVFTDTNGLAQAYWRLGMDAGCGNNRIAVTSQSISGNAFFCASAMPGPAGQINIGSGNNQRVEAGTVAPEKLRVWVSDGCNGVTNVLVTFTSIYGGGQFNGANSITINTSITGHAQVDFTLGPAAGKNMVEATFPGNTNKYPVIFILYGVTRNITQPTTFKGIVMDDASCSVGGAHCMLTMGSETLSNVYSDDAQGQFTFTAMTNSGPAHLKVDGSVATLLNSNAIPAGTFPALGYDLMVIPNAQNQLPTPVFIPPLNPTNAVLYDGTQDVILTCEGIDELKMIVKAGSMRNKDGSIPNPANPAYLSINQVHHDEIPMPIPDGASPPFAWTLQPGGAMFDPPVQIQYPNISGLPAGAIAYFLSFNHDTEQFNIVATGSVVPDGSCIVTDSGMGISVAGWGCNCPPYSASGDASKVDLEIDGVSESDETSVGAFICLNNTVPLSLSVDPSYTTGTVTMSVLSGNDKIKIVDDQTNEVSNLTWNLPSTFPALFVKVILPSSSPRDVTLELFYENDDIECRDTVKLTVFKVDIASDAINQYDPINATFDLINPTVVYGGSENSTAENLELTAMIVPLGPVPVSYTWSFSNIVETGFNPTPPSPSSAISKWDVGDVIASFAGRVTFTVVLEFQGGTTCKTTKEFEVGIRTDDTIVIGWIDPNLVTLPGGAAVWLTTKFPPAGPPVPSPLWSSLFLLDLSENSTTPNFQTLTLADRDYILKWMFKYSGDPNPAGVIPGGNFRGSTNTHIDEQEVLTFKAFLTNYKLFNRLQIKYRANSVGFVGLPVILKASTGLGLL